MYPSQHGAWTIGVKLPKTCRRWVNTLKNVGYKTALVGKAHFQPLASQKGSESIEAQPTLRDLDFWRDFKDSWYGFDHVELARNHADESHVGQHYAIWLEEKRLKRLARLLQPLPEKPPPKPLKSTKKSATGTRRPRLGLARRASLHGLDGRTQPQVSRARRARRHSLFPLGELSRPAPALHRARALASMYDPKT